MEFLADLAKFMFYFAPGNLGCELHIGNIFLLDQYLQFLFQFSHVAFGLAENLLHQLFIVNGTHVERVGKTRICNDDLVEISVEQPDLRTIRLCKFNGVSAGDICMV